MIDLRKCENLNKEEVSEFLAVVFEKMNPLEVKYEWDLYINDMSSRIFFDTEYYTYLYELTTTQLNEDGDSKIAINYPKIKDLKELNDIIYDNFEFEKVDEEFKNQKDHTLCEI